MKFNNIRLVGASNVDFPVVDANPAGPFILKSVDGLGPPEVAVSIANTVQEGGVYQGRRPQNRQIVMRVGLQPNWDVGQTAEQLRTILYGLLTPKYGQLVKAELRQSGIVIGQAEGHISRFEVAVFTKDPEIQITLDCNHPYLLAPAIKYQLPTRTVVANQTLLDILNEGTAPSGFWMGITFQVAPPTTLTISDGSPLGERMDISGIWAAGDTLVLDTRPGKRGVWKILSGSTVQTSILSTLSGASSWLQLYGGTNQLKINTTTFNWYNQGFGHTPAYWGV
jgi:hypothetical protein